MSQPLVCAGAQMMCTMGAAPSALVVPPTNKVLGGGPPAANIMDAKPIANVPPFGMCMSLGNPQVAAATSAALGVLTPMPCVPTPAGTWVPGSTTVMVGTAPALSQSSQLVCAFGGSISVVNAGQTSVMVG